MWEFFKKRRAKKVSTVHSQLEDLQRSGSHTRKLIEAYEYVETTQNAMLSAMEKILSAVKEATAHSLKTDCSNDDKNIQLSEIESSLRSCLTDYKEKVMACQKSYDMVCSLLQESSSDINESLCGILSAQPETGNRNFESEYYIPVEHQIQQDIANMQKIYSGNETDVSQKQISRNAF